MNPIQKRQAILFEEFPELDWLLELSDALHSNRLLDLYKYLMWSQRHLMLGQHTQSSEAQIAFGMAWKYRARVYDRKLPDDEIKMINQAVRALRKIRNAQD